MSNIPYVGTSTSSLCARIESRQFDFVIYFDNFPTTTHDAIKIFHQSTATVVGFTIRLFTANKLGNFHLSHCIIRIFTINNDKAIFLTFVTSVQGERSRQLFSTYGEFEQSESSLVADEHVTIRKKMKLGCFVEYERYQSYSPAHRTAHILQRRQRDRNFRPIVGSYERYRPYANTSSIRIRFHYSKLVPPRKQSTNVRVGLQNSTLAHIRVVFFHYSSFNVRKHTYFVIFIY